jgi:hypothetical protein
MNRLHAFALTATLAFSGSVLSASAQGSKPIETGTLHGQVHATTGRVSIYKVKGKDVLRLTNFKTSNGPDVHVILIAADDAKETTTFSRATWSAWNLAP